MVESSVHQRHLQKQSSDEQLDALLEQLGVKDLVCHGDGNDEALKVGVEIAIFHNLRGEQRICERP